ncbi:MAG: alkaline phosphatase PhoX [Actinomycetes bacterium]
MGTTREQSDLTRRSFLGRGAATTLGIALAGSLEPLAGAAGVEREGRSRFAGHRDDGYGPLVDDPDGRIALPEAFSYTVVAQSGVTMLDDGVHRTPSSPDGTASFVRRGGNGSVLVNNHEIRGLGPLTHGVPKDDPRLVYDPGPGANAGTTNIVVDKDGDRVREYVSLAGTHTNCAGGKTPWQTWLTCEETDLVPVAGNGLTRRHGYVFEVDPYRRKANRDPHPIKALGRFEHEALAVDPETWQIYETEDANAPHGMFYRWTPPSRALPLERRSLRALDDDAGTLEALSASTAGGAHVPDLCVAVEPGTTYDVKWVEVPDRDATTVRIRQQFTDAQVTRSRKLEGAWWGRGGAYFVASFARQSDGSAVVHDGQVWFYDPLAHTIELKLRFARAGAANSTSPDGPDNITVSPYGGVILAEDGGGKQHLIGSTGPLNTYFLARNDLPGDGEFTGPNFSRNKKVLFANVFNPGHVFAITGPWRKDHDDRD